MRLGDKVKAVTNALGIEQCDSCVKRQAWLNDLSDKLGKLVGVQDASEQDLPQQAKDET